MTTEQVADGEEREQDAGKGGAPIAVPPVPPLGDAAYHGVAGKFLRLVGPNTEADQAALLVQFLAAVGNCVGRNPFIKVEETLHHANLYLVLVGMSSRGRKGTALDRVKAVVAPVDPVWAKARIMSGLSSGEGLIDVVKDRDGPRDVRVFLVQPEFATILKNLDRVGNTLSAVMRELWDSGNAQVMTKNNPIRATGAHVSAVGHVTRDELRSGLNVTESANGFANRFLYVATHRSKRLPRGGRVDQAALDELVTELEHRVAAAREIGEVDLAASAIELWEDFYNSVPDDVPGLFGAVTSRSEPQVLRMALIYALLDGLSRISEDHLRAALEVWRYCEDSARWVFDDAVGDPLADALLALLRSRPDGVSRTEISNHMGKNRAKVDLDRALHRLATCGLTRRQQAPSSGGGRPPEVWVASSSRVTKETKEPPLDRP